MSFLCPCCPKDSKQRLVEMSPFRDAGSDSDSGEAPAPTTLADKAKGWLSKAAAPLGERWRGP